MKHNPAKDMLWPTDANILVRVVFLYVGQGASTLVMVASGQIHKTLLLDINMDKERGGIDVPSLMADLLGTEALDVFVNTHPHDDHIRGLGLLADKLAIEEVWHSGHVPGKKHEEAYKELQAVVKKVKDAGGVVTTLLGTRDEHQIGDARYYILAPAKYVADEVLGEDAETRSRRIHEQCAVLKFGIGDKWVLIPGDADRDAFEKFIGSYHRERLSAVVLAAPHHGSRSFFRYQEEDEPYTDALDSVDPEYVVVSAPSQDESPHGHPHDDAIQIYAQRVGRDNVLHTGAQRYSFICDIYRDGTWSGMEDDKGILAESYPISDGGGDGNTDSAASKGAPAIIGTRVDDRPMGNRQ